MEHFKIEIATEQDIEIITKIIQTVLNQMPDNDWFAADNGEHVRQILANGLGKCYQAIEIKTGKTAGIFIVAFPGENDENLGHDIGLKPHQLKLVAHMDSAAVLPQYRGHNLQLLLMKQAENDLKIAGYRYLMCTIHPDNVYSKNAALSQNYKVMMTKEKYGGYLRDILLKEI